MIDEKYIELINKEIDGIITSDEKARLHAYLERNFEAKNIYQEQIQTAKLLNRVPAIEPPPNLKKRIMNSIDLNRYTVKERKRVSESLFSNRSSKWVPKLVFTFTFGLILGILLHMAFLRDPTQKYWMSSRDFVGTIGMHEKDYFKKLDQIPIDLPDVKGELILNQMRNHLGCEVNLSPIGEFELLVEFNPAHIQFHGFKPSSKSKIVLDNGEDYIRALHSEEVQYVLFFLREAPATTQIDVTLLQKGDAKFHRKIHLESTSEKEEEQK